MHGESCSKNILSGNLEKEVKYNWKIKPQEHSGNRAKTKHSQNYRMSKNGFANLIKQ